MSRIVSIGKDERANVKNTHFATMTMRYRHSMTMMIQAIEIRFPTPRREMLF